MGYAPRIPPRWRLLVLTIPRSAVWLIKKLMLTRIACTFAFDNALYTLATSVAGRPYCTGRNRVFFVFCSTVHDITASRSEIFVQKKGNVIRMRCGEENRGRRKNALFTHARMLMRLICAFMPCVRRQRVSQIRLESKSGPNEFNG